MTTFLSDFVSLGEISRQLGEALHRVNYAVQKLGIKPAAKIGGRCVYHQSVVQGIEDEIRAIDARKQQCLARAKRSVEGSGVILRTADELDAGIAMGARS